MPNFHIPQPPRGDSPETWKATIRAFNMVFEDVVFEGYSKRQVNDWVKHEIIDTAEITDISRIGLGDEAKHSPDKSRTEILLDLISEKLEFYQNQILSLEQVIKESEQQASIFGDEDQYNQARKRDIERYRTLADQLKDLQACEIIVK